MIVNICFLIIGFIGIILLYIGLKKFNEASLMVDAKQENIQKEQEEIKKLNRDKQNLQWEINQLTISLDNYIKGQEKEYKEQKERLDEQLDLYKQKTDHARSIYVDNIEKEYDLVEATYKRKTQELKDKQEKIEKDIKDAGSRFEALKSEINAATEAQLREQQMQLNQDFYKLNPSKEDLDDILKLESVKPMLHNPVILSKLIWSTYFLKQANALCSRVCGEEPVTGIYKITNLDTKQVYVGQSVSIQDRIKQHLKAGLGIDASSTNKLYKAMSQYGIWNFTFEVLEQCPREKLNEAEKRWIEIYRANELGYNSNCGIGKKEIKG